MRFFSRQFRNAVAKLVRILQRGSDLGGTFAVYPDLAHDRSRKSRRPRRRDHQVFGEGNTCNGTSVSAGLLL
jgi:hypothetical protein